MGVSRERRRGAISRGSAVVLLVCEFLLQYLSVQQGYWRAKDPVVHTRIYHLSSTISIPFTIYHLHRPGKDPRVAN